jgi:hypothetical protein
LRGAPQGYRARLLLEREGRYRPDGRREVGDGRRGNRSAHGHGRDTACTGATRGPLTAFTGVLLEILEQGIANAPGLLTVEHVFTELRERLRARDFPEPQFAGSSCGASIVLAQNVLAQGKVGEANLQALRRTGRYDEAQRRLLLSAAQGDSYSIREVALQLRRTGDYAIADELERAAMSGHIPLHEFVFGRLLSN